ncbi:MAG: YceI family protein [Beutenbergiaceae bacterium]
MTIPTGTFTIDTAHSELGFTVRHSGIAKVRGRFNGVTGTVTIAEDFASSSAQVEIDAASVHTGNEQRDGHLVSPDFWDAANKPTWTFNSTSIVGAGEEFTLNGDLTINGITKPVALAVEYNGSATGMAGEVLGFSATTEISRKDYDLTWNVALEGGGLLVGDTVKIAIEIEAARA